ncbi:CarD family transcriptional regulator [Pseudodesulfovibrio nedwellii]|uniref:CarD family transcriptional regulator n=1 Tax=Pseudodesulfovibrio nedwellii TaxID=2973072 RepID=A0ABN6S673_9BACT|nr:MULTISPECIES: CarD family transcriptional regulator [Pseudodesulfovibrio]BDQ38787.1 CarD family transcriptional regulator [Pseudodesulfovibrio nedwellii]
MFKVNELVVYPSQGVGRVERIESQEIGGVKADFYIVRILSNNVTLMVPVANAENVGLRSVCCKRLGQEIFESLNDRTGFTGYTGQNWNRRYREYSEKLKSGDLADVAYVLKELFLIGRDKELSFGERRLLEQAMGLVSMELAYSLGRDQENIKEDINEMFADVIAAQEKDD